MLGEELNSSVVTERGLVGNRAFALIDEETGKVASAKNPRKWGRLFDFRSIFVEPPQPENIPPVKIALPNGNQIFSTEDKNTDQTLSKAIGRNVRLIRANLEEPSYEEDLARYRWPCTKK